MMNTPVGYAYLVQALQLSVITLQRPAAIKPVTRVTVMGDALAVPSSVAPAPGATLAHTLFALKYEGINLAVLAQALPRIPAQAVLEELHKAPTGVYTRKLCYLWEAFSGTRLDYETPIRGVTTPLFDPQRYVTGPSVRNTRWRVDFNGLGTLEYCATVERTPAITALLDDDVVQRAQAFLQALPASMMDRAMSWAYLHETRESFAIEKEAPDDDKSRRFIQLLRQAHERRALSEDYLVALQNSTISSPFDKAASFRHQQNYLSNGLRGAAGVSYIPPQPALCAELMEHLLGFANGTALQVEPLVAAAVVSFGFVFLHPFMDGNGRLSRFLIHHTLCRSGALGNGLLLPVSVAMKHQEARYLETLQGFSRPAREYWEVQWIDADDLTFEFHGHSALYRYWDATQCVAFTLEMAERALEVELRDETLFLQRYDTVFSAVNERYDVRGSVLSNLVMMCLDNQGTVSRNRRKQFKYDVPDEVLDFIEQTTRQCLAVTVDCDQKSNSPPTLPSQGNDKS
jgi:hypothetical protein